MNKKFKFIIVFFISTSIYLVNPFIIENEPVNVSSGDPIWPHVINSQQNI